MQEDIFKLQGDFFIVKYNFLLDVELKLEFYLSFSVIKLAKQDLHVAISKFKDKHQEIYQNGCI